MTSLPSAADTRRIERYKTADILLQQAPRDPAKSQDLTTIVAQRALDELIFPSNSPLPPGVSLVILQYISSSLLDCLFLYAANQMTKKKVAEVYSQADDEQMKQLFNTICGSPSSEQRKRLIQMFFAATDLTSQRRIGKLYHAYNRSNGEYLNPGTFFSIAVAPNDLEELDLCLLKLLCITEQNKTGIFGDKSASTATFVKTIANHSPRLQKLSLRSCNLNASIAKSLTKCKLLQELDLSETNLTNGELSVISKGCSALKKLNLADCRKLSDESFQAILHHQELEELDLSVDSAWDCTLEKSFQKMVTSCPKLRKLNLSLKSDVDLRPISNEVVDAIAKCQELEELDLSGTDVTDDHIRIITGGCPKLKKLKLRDCRNLTVDVLYALANARNLEEFKIPKYDLDRALVTDDHILAIARGCRLLKKLTLRDCSNLTKFSFDAIASCQNLEELNLNKTAVDDASILAIARGCPKLKKLNLRECTNLTAVSFSAVSNCSELEELYLSSNSVTDACIEKIVTNRSRLQKLIIEDCQTLTAKGYQTLALCSQLKELWITRFDTPEEFLKMLQKALPGVVRFNELGDLTDA